MSLGIHAVYPTRKHLLRMRRLIDFLVESFAAPTWTHMASAPTERALKGGPRRQAGSPTRGRKDRVD
jgi:hypothetical protein